MAIYTYEVDHGEDIPSVGGGDTFNGSPIIAVCFDSALENASLAREIIENVLFNHDMDDQARKELNKVIELI